MEGDGERVGGGHRGTHGLEPEHDGEGAEQGAESHQAHRQVQVSVQDSREVRGSGVTLYHTGYIYDSSTYIFVCIFYCTIICQLCFVLFL